VGGWLTLRHANDPNENSVCIREVQKTIEDSSKALIEKKIAEYGFGALFDAQESRIKRLGGGDCIFRGMQNHNSDNIKSLEGRTFAWADEAHKLSKRSIELLTPTIRAPGSKLVFTWNPENADDPVETLFRENAQDPDFLCLTVNYYDNPWFPDELRKDMERDKRRDPAKYSHIWEGAYRALADGQVFRNWRVGEMSPPDNVVWFYGADWGFAQDATAAVRCCIPKDGVLYVDAEVYGVGVPTDALPGLLAGLPDAGKWPMRGDSARPETIDYLRRHGFPKLRSAHKGKGSVEDGITFLQGMDIVVHPGCVNLIRELKTYSYKADPRTQEILPVVMDGNDHVIDALRYACEGLHRRGKMVKATEVIAPNVLERPRDYQSNRRETSDWKTV
jgi:phage terminase large subunit